MEAMTVHSFGTTVIVVGSYRERQRGVKRWRFVDTWVYKKNGWVLVSAAASPVAK